MKALLDLNVLLDVIQSRHPHYNDSAAVLSAARSGRFEAVIPAHALTTIFYLIQRANDTHTANQTVDWLLQHFEIPAINKHVFRQARLLRLTDFEDSVVASIAQRETCQ
jgi:predicted nucleic acid-binding protein